jgi:hypothetical protein
MRIAPLALLVGAVCLAGCNDDNNNLIVVPSVNGTFTLQTANGSPLPAVVVDSVSPPLRIEVLAGHITLRTNGTFEDEVDFQQSLGGLVTSTQVVCPGTFTVSGNTISFTETGTGICVSSFTGTTSGNTLTTSIRGVALVFVH